MLIFYNFLSTRCQDCSGEDAPAKQINLWKVLLRTGKKHKNMGPKQTFVFYSKRLSSTGISFQQIPPCCHWVGPCEFSLGQAQARDAPAQSQSLCKRGLSTARGRGAAGGGGVAAGGAELSCAQPASCLATSESIWLWVKTNGTILG